LKRALIALTLALGLGQGCAVTPPSQLSLPQPQVRAGVRIEITRLAGTWTRPRGLIGTVENVSPASIGSFDLRLDGLGYQGNVVGRAAARIDDLAPGEKRGFRADFPSPIPSGLHQVMIGSAHVRR